MGMLHWIKLVIITKMLFEVHVQAQDTLSVVTKSGYKCGSSLKLRCAPAGCCNGIINWSKDVTPIMGGGVTIPAGTGKYTQVIVGTSHFDFTIEDLEAGDFSGSYKCIYNGASSNGVTLDSAGYYCPPCKRCGWYSFGLACIGALIVYCGAFLGSRYNDKLKKYWLQFSTGTAVVGMSIVFIVTFTIGTCTCWCDLNDNWYTSIVVGLGVVALVILSAIGIAYCYDWIVFMILAVIVVITESEIVFKCSKSGYKKVEKWRWYKITQPHPGKESTTEEIQNNDNGKYTVKITDNGSSLTIKDIALSDAASYSCEAIYAQGTKRATTTAELTVKDVSTKNSSPNTNTKSSSPAHVKTVNESSKSELDKVFLNKSLPQIGDTNLPSPTGHHDPDKRNVTKLSPIEITSVTKETKNKNKNKQPDGRKDDIL